MRTTLTLPDALAEAAKARAAQEGRSLTGLVEDGLRTVLARASGPGTAATLPTYGDPDGHILVDLTDRDAVWGALDADGLR
jgi:hypothetical protein